MYLNTLDVTLNPRTEADGYNLKVNESTLQILALIFEFKVATTWHISRFLTQKDQSKYVYTKLRRMWKAGLLESFKVYSGSLAGIPVFYMLSKTGLKELADQGRYGLADLKAYPKAKTLLSWGLFKHEAQAVELASLEIKNNSNNLKITCQGEISSQVHQLLSNKNIEVLTPDYIIVYHLGQTEHLIYTEFERTQKSNDASLRKVERYIRCLDFEQRQRITLRLIFQTPSMEQSFWVNILSNQPTFLQNLRIVTTNLTLLHNYNHYLEPIYISEPSVRLIKDGRLKAEILNRIKLFSFL
jgi:hypothetical protein